MSLNSSNAFSYAISGSFTEDTINKYSDYVNNSTGILQNAGGWLGEQPKKTMVGFESFVNSRAWEMGKRLLGAQDGEYVSRYAIGYLGSISALQGAEGYMRDYIMAHSGVMQDYLDEEMNGYDGEFSPFCTGVGEKNLFHRRAMNGLLNLQVVDDKPQVRHTHYKDTVGGSLSFRERVDIQKTWAAIDHHRLTTAFDITSVKGDFLASHVEETEE